MPKFSRLLTIGDSVLWGQGLLREHKIDYLVWQAVGNGGEPVLLAHSGATIGVNSSGGPAGVSPEIPVSYPTILDQCNAFADNPATVDLIILNGGGNDVNFRTLLNPLLQSADLTDKIQQRCFRDMKVLLGAVKTKFQAARIIVTGYYPILSNRSELVRIPGYLSLHGIGLPAFLEHGPIIQHIINNSLQFWDETNANLRQACEELDAGAGRITFVPAPFDEHNSAFADDPLLWAVSSTLAPQDETAATRHEVCELQYPVDIQDLFSLNREQCFRASAGHPNVRGAAKIAGAMVGVLSEP